MELLWVTSNWSQVPYGALVAGQKADGGPLYVAQVYTDLYDIWLAGNYDPGKRCAEYLFFLGGRNSTISCGEVWKLLIAKYGMLNLYISWHIYSTFSTDGLLTNRICARITFQFILVFAMAYLYISRIIHESPWITIFGSPMMRFANDFYSWRKNRYFISYTLFNVLKTQFR